MVSGIRRWSLNISPHLMNNGRKGGLLYVYDAAVFVLITCSIKDCSIMQSAPRGLSESSETEVTPPPYTHTHTNSPTIVFRLVVYLMIYLFYSFFSIGYFYS